MVFKSDFLTTHYTKIDLIRFFSVLYLCLQGHFIKLYTLECFLYECTHITQFNVILEFFRTFSQFISIPSDICK